MVFVIATMFTSGCPSSNSVSSKRATPGLKQRADRGEALLDTAISQLQDLPTYVQTDLTPPQVILDSRTSGDRQDVLATLLSNRNQQEGPRLFNILHVPAGNSRFRALGIRPGDVVKYYIDVDTSGQITESDVFETKNSQDSKATWSEGFVREKAADFPVAQVLDENTLLVTRALPFPITVPVKMEVWRYSDERMREFGGRLSRYARTGDPRLGWEPSPDEGVLERILDRLNPWSRQNKPLDEWQRDKLLTTLPELLRKNSKLESFLSEETLSRLSFNSYEVRFLQQAVWIRDISEWARGNSFDELDRATALFDWTIRNIQLDAEDDYLPRWPWQTLLYGHGTVPQRAWLFAGLCRQQGLDVVILTLPANKVDQVERFWLPALVHKGELYLFDTLLGLPIAGPEGQGVATLAQVRSAPELLQVLDIDQYSYDVEIDALADVHVNLVVAPFELSQRAQLLEKELTGKNRLELALDATLLEESIKNMSGVARVQLWDEPFRTLLEQLNLKSIDRTNEAAAFQPFVWRPKLYKARVLHFQGKREQKKDVNRRGLEEVIDSHQQAARLYTDPRVRPKDSVLAELPSPEKREIYKISKDCATYWLGLLQFDEGRYKSSINWLQRVLKSDEVGLWTNGVRYNLARSYEAIGETGKAIALYKAGNSPQHHGNLLRARRLQESAGIELETAKTE